MKDITQQTFQEFSRNFIGVPYYKFDCYDIVKLFYHKVFGISLQEYFYPDPLDKKNMEFLIASQKSKFRKVPKPEFGDIVLLRVQGLPCHLGVCVSDKKIVHTTVKTGCIIEPLANWKNKVEGYYRHG